MFRAMAHQGIISPTTTIKDADSAKEGAQELTISYTSATGWAESVVSLLYELVDDSSVNTNMDIRTGVTVTQLLCAVAELNYKVDALVDAIGVPTVRKKAACDTMYNLVVEQQGFDPNKQNQQLDINSDLTTEQLLPKLLRTRSNPIVKEEVHPKAPTLREMLDDIKRLSNQ